MISTKKEISYLQVCALLFNLNILKFRNLKVLELKIACYSRALKIACYCLKIACYFPKIACYSRNGMLFSSPQNGITIFKITK